MELMTRNIRILGRNYLGGYLFRRSQCHHAVSWRHASVDTSALHAQIFTGQYERIICWVAVMFINYSLIPKLNTILGKFQNATQNIYIYIYTHK